MSIVARTSWKWAYKQLLDIRGECFGKALKDHYRSVPFAALHAA